MKRTLTVCAAIVFAVTADGLAQAQRDAFASQLRRASQGNDRTAIAAMIAYPLTISIGGVRIPIADAETFLARYDDIFTPELRDAIVRGTDGVVVQQVNGELRITSIVVPPVGSTATPALPADAKSGDALRNPAPRRIAIRIGPRPTQVPGALSRDSIDTFIVFVPKGKLASVRLERVPAGAAAIRVVNARTGAPLAARHSADARFASGRPSEDAEYRIEVRRIGNDDAHLPYILSLSLR